SQKYSLETSNPRFSELLKSFFTISIPDNALVLTDDFAPVEYFTKDLIRDYY
ncbi:hypothetical protein FJ208_02340, partial [Candidatus Gribaldobacteria bacterium]|nr:hypothetical protein [Candidatus Gribaldobacteria bacterium]